MSNGKLCRWHCGNQTDRRCGICVNCCDARDKRNRQIDAGLMAYTPPSKRPGHPFFEGSARKGRTDKQKAALATTNAARVADSAKELPVAEF
jgi:hypothetical protein